MKLEWFRTHQRVVWWILVPLIIISFTFFGLTSALDDSKRGSSKGPGFTYNGPRGESHYMSPTEVIGARQTLTNFDSALFGRRQAFAKDFNPATYNSFRFQKGEDHDGRATTDEVMIHMGSYIRAQSLGFEVGPDELNGLIVDEIKRQIAYRDQSYDAKASEENYRKLLHAVQLTAGQFDRLTYEYGVAEKYLRHMATLSANVDDATLYVAYAKEKEIVRIRYKEIPSADRIEKVDAPTDAKIQEFYDQNKDIKARIETLQKDRKTYQEANELRQLSNMIEGFMYQEPKMSADVIVFQTDKFLAELKPTDDELKRYFEDFRNSPDLAAWKDKKLEDVKDDVTKKWLETNRPLKARQKAATFQQELDRAIEAHETAQKALPEAERKEFDIPAYLKDKGATHWVTAELTEEEFKKGKEEINATDIKWVATRFNDARPHVNMVALKRFNYPDFVESNKPEKGLWMARMKTFKAQEPKALEAAKPGIIAHLKSVAAVELARKEAEQLKTDWEAGNNLPDVEKLDEIVTRGSNLYQGEAVDFPKYHALAAAYSRAPKKVGEPINIAETDPEPKPNEVKPVKTPHKLFYVGFAVERTQPTFEAFEKDTDWNRDQTRTQVANSNIVYTAVEYVDQLKKSSGIRDTTADLPLDQNRRKSQ